MSDDEEFVRHLDSLGVPHEMDRQGSRLGASGIGLDRNTEEGAIVAFAGALRPNKPLHRVVAWVLLIAFGVPVVLGVLHLAGLLFEALAGR